MATIKTTIQILYFQKLNKHQMKALSIISLSLLLSSMSMTAQNTIPVTNIRHSQYPQITADHRGVFQLKAPDAKEVIVDINGKKYNMERDANGVWTATTDVLTSGINYYFMYVDGVQICDPASETFYGCSRMSSCIEVPYAEGDVRFELADVPHGEITMRRYFSKNENAWRRMFVYLPPSYQTATDKKYPVLYIQHGGGEDERGWALQGRTDIILDNLIAQGKSEEMIVVMSDGNCRDFIKELTEECIPLVEKTYRVKADAANRAMAGLSMGGIQTLNIAVDHPELFQYVGVFSSGWFASANNNFPGMGADKQYKTLTDRKDYFNKQFRQLWLSMGGPEDIAYNNCKVMRQRFDEIGIKYSYFETPGGHTWPVWRESLYHFAQLLFK